MEEESTFEPGPFQAYEAEAVRRVVVGPGCTRRDLPDVAGARAWIVDIEPGYEWPAVDHHGKTGEVVYVVSGDLIEGDKTYGAGTYVVYAPHSRHRPRSKNGVRLFGFNPL
jgi:hypothetical protein